MSLRLVGTEPNIDFDGPRRVERLLKHFRPDIIALDMDEERVALLLSETDEQKIARVLHENPGANSETVKEFIRLNCYEYKTAKKYADERGIAVELVDAAYGSIPEIKITVLESMKKNYFLSVDEFQTQKKYRVEQRLLPANLLLYVTQRDEKMAEQLRKLPASAKTLFFAPWGILYAEYNNLYKQLSDLTPYRMMLSEADKY